MATIEKTKPVRARTRKSAIDTLTAEGARVGASPPTGTSATIVQMRRQVQERMAELRPLHEEYLALAQIDENFQGVMPDLSGGNTNGSTVTKTKPQGKVIDRALVVINEHPQGITVNEIAEALDTAPGYIYAIVRRLLEEERVTRRLGKVLPK